MQVSTDKNNDEVSASKRPQRIMIVDDDPDITLTFAKALKESNFEVDLFNDPEIALFNFKTGYYDLLLLDIRMPKIDGFRLYSKLKEIDNRVKVCFITASDLYYNTLKKDYPLVEIGCFIHKPILMNDLVREVSTEMGKPVSLKNNGNFNK